MDTQKIIDSLHSKSLSETLQKLLLLATQAEDMELVKWVRFELTGYQGSNVKNNDIVPEYRDVVGYHTDDLNRKFVIEQDDLKFVNSTRLRAGVVELEVYKEHGLILKSPQLCNLIYQHLEVKVTSFHVSGPQIQNVLANIKSELANKLTTFEPGKITKASNEHVSEGIIELKPNVFGLGVNLNALQRKWFPWKK